MPEFAQWLESQPDSDPDVKDLKDFATAHANTWPRTSNELVHYATALKGEQDRDKRDELLLTLGQYYDRWFQAERHKGDWASILGIVALLLAGLIVGGALAYGLFWRSDFIPTLGQVDTARGLITFLFAFVTVSIIVLVAIAMFWMDLPEIEARFTKAKDLIMILIGVLGTIIGFYFGSTSSVSPPILLTPLTLSASSATPGENITVSTRASGGIAPYIYTVLMTDPSGKTTTIVKDQSSKDGGISEQVSIPEGVKPPAAISLKVIIRDAKGVVGESATQTLSIVAKDTKGQQVESPAQTPPTTSISVAPLSLSPSPAKLGDKITVSTRASGGTTPYIYTVLMTDPSGKTTTIVKDQSSKDGGISEQVSVPDGVKPGESVTLKVTIKDQKGQLGESAAQQLSIAP